MKLFKVEFKGMYPVGSALVLLAEDTDKAKEMAKKTIIHTDVFQVSEVSMDTPGVVVYLNGDY